MIYPDIYGLPDRNDVCSAFGTRFRKEGVSFGLVVFIRANRGKTTPEFGWKETWSCYVYAFSCVVFAKKFTSCFCESMCFFLWVFLSGAHCKDRFAYQSFHSHSFFGDFVERKCNVCKDAAVAALVICSILIVANLLAYFCAVVLDFLDCPLLPFALAFALIPSDLALVCTL